MRDPGAHHPSPSYSLGDPRTGGETERSADLRRVGQVIGIDHGAERSGLAITDPLQLIASALESVPTAELIERLRHHVAVRQVEGFVVGLPTGLRGEPTDATAAVHAFIERLRDAFPGQWVETADERFTSRIAERTLLQSGKGRQARRDKSQLDRISATLILQGWLERRSRST